MTFYNFLVLIASLGLTACKKSEEVGHYTTGEIEYRVPLDKAGVYDGICTYFYKRGAKKAELPFVKHHINGIVRRYYPSGKLMSAATYKNGQQWGEVKGYYPTGELRSQGNIYGKIPQGPMRYLYRNGELQHLRIYDKVGKVVDLAEFTPGENIDKRYTQPIIYTVDDTVEIDKTISFEVILASRSSEDVQVKFDSRNEALDSTSGTYSKRNYLVHFRKAGMNCLSGIIYQREHSADKITTTYFPWKHCFYVTKKN